VHKELQELVVDFKKFLLFKEKPKKAKACVRIQQVVKEATVTPQKEPRVEEQQPIVIPPKVAEKAPVKPILALPCGLDVKDLCLWYEKRFKMPALSPLSDKKAKEAKKRFVDGTDAPAIVILLKKPTKEKLYFNIQQAIHRYIAPCCLLTHAQFDEKFIQQARLILAEDESIDQYLLRLSAEKRQVVEKIPTVKLEDWAVLSTYEGKKRLWNALKSLVFT
jgi:hypothetical protein